MKKFIKGLRLSEFFYREAVKPILSKKFPGLAYSAGLLGRGSDVLGFDTPQSTDHDWGPALIIFLKKEDQKHRLQIDKSMKEKLPFEIHGFSTNFVKNEDWTFRLEKNRKRPINHRIVITTLEDFFRKQLGFDPNQPGRPNEIDWFLTPQQRLRSVTSGKFFYDGLNKLEAIRKKLSWYPKDLWIYLMACQWKRISQEEPFMARCGDIGDELGSKIIAARMINELMSLCFLMERQFAPYSKWFGTAFAHLSSAKKLTPIFKKIFISKNWKDREKNLSKAYVCVIRLHNALGITSFISEKVTPFYSRPYLVPHSKRIVEALDRSIKSKTILNLTETSKIGAIGQFINSTEILDYQKHGWKQLKNIYNLSND